MIESLVTYVAKSALVVISLCQRDIASFLDNKTKQLSIVIQIRVVARDASTSKADKLRFADFIKEFSDHAEVQHALIEILHDGDYSSVLRTSQVCFDGRFTLHHVLYVLFMLHTNLSI